METALVCCLCETLERALLTMTQIGNNAFGFSHEFVCVFEKPCYFVNFSEKQPVCHATLITQLYSAVSSTPVRPFFFILCTCSVESE